MDKLQYIIFSFEHNCYWNPARRGYTNDIDKAGRYSLNEAIEICCHTYPDPHMKRPNEVMMVAPECRNVIENLRTELKASREATDAALSELNIARRELVREMAWRGAIEDEGAVTEIGWTNDAKESLQRLIDWHVRVALDPSVSSAARGLIQRGKDQANKDRTCDHGVPMSLECEKCKAAIDEPILAAKADVDRLTSVIETHRTNAETMGLHITEVERERDEARAEVARLNEECARLRRSAGDVCAAWLRFCLLTKSAFPFSKYITFDGDHKHTAATVRALSDAIGREPR